MKQKGFCEYNPEWAQMMIYPEHTAYEKRHWVRVTKACNNRCVFCLDRDMLDGHQVGLDEIADDLRRGRARGAERVVISGGEASTHPDFVKIIELATRLGYTWVQTISNGRMFVYSDFLDRAVAAGLREITFSLHSHEEGKFDRLTGAPGSYGQAVRGLVNALRKGNLVVSIDIVLTAINSPTLAETVTVFANLGASEFDLLYPVPFGNAWHNRDEVMPDDRTVARQLKAVFAEARRRNLVIWTNRLPPRLLEGNEVYIQPSSKMYDEVYGRRAMFEEFFRGTHDFPCGGGERCGYCCMAGFCDYLRHLREVFNGKGGGMLLVDDLTADPIEILGRVKTGTVIIDMLPGTGMKTLGECVGKWRAAGTVVRLRLRSLEVDVAGLSEIADEIEVIVNRFNVPRLITRPLPVRGNARVILSPPEYLDDEYAADVTGLRVFFKEYNTLSLPYDVSVRGVPYCLLDGQQIEEGIPVTELGMITESGSPDFDAIVAGYLKSSHCAQGMKCLTCPEKHRCKGLHIEYARLYGFGEIRGMD